MDTRYNGWTNYETWLVNLWYDDFFNDDAQRIYDEAEADKYSTRKEVATQSLADYIEETVKEFSNIPDTGLVADLLGAAFSDVNWYEIAEHYIDEADKEEEPEEEEDEKESAES